MAGKKRRKTADLTESEWSLDLTGPGMHPLAHNLDFFFDFAQEVYVILDSSFNVQRLNRQFALVLGWEPADFSSKPFATLVTATDQNRVIEILANASSHTLMADFECRCDTASGGTIAMKWRFSAQADGMLYLAGNKVPDLDQTAQQEPVQSADQTAVIADEETFADESTPAEDLAFYQALFATFPEPLFLVTKAGFLEANEAALKLVGIADSADLIGRPLDDFAVSDGENGGRDLLATQLDALAKSDTVHFEWAIGQSGGSLPLQMRLSTLAEGSDTYLLRPVPKAVDTELAAALERRVTEIELLGDSVNTISTVRDPQQLLEVLVNFTKERFLLYHAQVFLLDDFGGRLRLIAGAGQEGDSLVKHGYQVDLSDRDNLISYVGSMQRSRFVPNIKADPDFAPVAILPETRAELALPIMGENRLLGVLDLQCVTVGRFENEESRVYETLSALIGMALQNARNYDEAIKSRQELARLSRRFEDQRRVGDISQLGTRNSFSFVDEELIEFVGAENGTTYNTLQLERQLRIAEQKLGAITITDPQMPSEDSEIIVDAVLSSLSAHLENLRLTEQTEEALGETELLYHVSARLNAAMSINEVFQAVLESGLAQNLASADLTMLELDEHGQPEFAVIGSAWQEAVLDSELPYPTVGQRSYLPDLPGSSGWIDHPDDIIMIEDINQDWRLDSPTRQWFQVLKMGSALLMPLNYRGRWIGLFRMTWRTPRKFEANEQRVYRALMVQMTTAVNNLMLLDESQIRAAQLEKLSQAETDLSLANDEDAILQALVRQMPSRWLRKATLSYLDDLRAGLMQQMVSLWTPEGFLAAELPLLEQEPVGTDGLAQLWLQYPGEVLNVNDVETDYRVPPAVKAMAAEEGWRAVTILPLRSANRWQGLVTFYWAEAYELSDDQTFLFDRLMEPVAAVVASRRAQLEQQQAEAAERVARRETESLYNASRRINEAETLAMVLSATVESAGVTDFSSGVIVVFDEESGEGEVVVQVVANWYGGEGRRPDEVGVRQVLYSPTAAEFLMPDDIIFIENLQTDPRVPLQVRSNFFGRQGAEALLLLPLLAGGRKLGAMMLTSETPHPFSDRERRVFASLAPQIAVAIQNRSLLQAAQNRARRERILREITAQVRSSNDVDTILRIAAEQVGRAFGRTTFATLDENIRREE